jgi:hypothetical protein
MIIWAIFVALLHVNVSKAFNAACSYENGDKLPCKTALFSSETPFALSGTISMANDFFCEHTGLLANTELIAIPRGVCGFQEKVKLAENIGFKGIVFVNNDEDVFPVGATDGFISKVQHHLSQIILYLLLYNDHCYPRSAIHA